MSDLTDLRMDRLAGLLEAAQEAKAAPKGGGKGGKVKPRPPWLDDDEDESDDDTDTSDSDDTDDEEDDDDVPPPKRRGAKKSRPAGERKAARITVWGPPSQSVDITRARVPDRGSDARVNREARRSHSADGIAKPGTGRAGGNGVTSGRSDPRAAAPTPGNLRGGRRRRGDDGPAPKGEMGEGSAWGRSGSAINMRKPGNLKSLWDYEPGEVQAALEVAEKVLGSLRSDFGRAE